LSAQCFKVNVMQSVDHNQAVFSLLISSNHISSHLSVLTQHGYKNFVQPCLRVVCTDLRDHGREYCSSVHGA